MRLQPHERILDFWRAIARHSFRDGMFVRGSTAAGNSISDAEQLLCLLLPATTQPYFILDQAGRTRDDVREALRLLGNPEDETIVPIRLIRAQIDYFDCYRDVNGQPVFTAGQYLTGDPQVIRHDVVESFAVSIRLSLAAIGFSRAFQRTMRRPDLRAETDRLGDLASSRLTAAMIGLLRSFVVHEFPDDSPSGFELRQLLGQEQRDGHAVLAEFTSHLIQTRASLSEIFIGTGRPTALLADDSLQFACGWTWGVVPDAPEVDTEIPDVPQRNGVAAYRPDLYFSLLAMEAISELFAERTRVLALLNEEQQRLARALQLRVDLTRTYWATLATFGEHRWPLERLPWHGASDYQSLVVAAMTSTAFYARRGDTSLSFGYLQRVLARLATRYEIVKPPRADGEPPTIRLRGELVLLAGSSAVYRATSFAALLFDTVIRTAVATDHDQLRQDLGDLADLIWAHLGIDQGPPDLRRLGDQPGPDWHNVLRLVTGLTWAVSLADDTRRATAPLAFVHELLADADETVERIDIGQHVKTKLERARRIIDEHPARAAALLYEIHAEIDAFLLSQDSDD